MARYVTDRRRRRLMQCALLIFCIVIAISILRVGRSTGKSNKQADVTQLDAVSVKPELRNDLTVVTAYMNIGRFQKGNGGNEFFTPELYRTWMTVFARLESPVVAYFDTDEAAQYFGELRRRYLPENLTNIIRVEKRDLWSFQIEPEIASVFATPGYAQHHPNTVFAPYSSAMHAKYELVQRTIRENPFRTRYICWLDIGLFRDLVPQGPNGTRFSMYLPPGFQEDSVAYTAVYGERNPALSPQQILFGDVTWVCGCFFVGQLDVVHRWTLEYQAAVRKTIADNMTGIDQQVIYIAFNTMNPQTKIQTYAGDGRYNGWFHLGYVSRDAGIAWRQGRDVQSTPSLASAASKSR